METKKIYQLILRKNEVDNCIVIGTYENCNKVLARYLGAYDALVRNMILSKGQVDEIRNSFYLEDYN